MFPLSSPKRVTLINHGPSVSGLICWDAPALSRRSGEGEVLDHRDDAATGTLRAGVASCGTYGAKSAKLSA